MSGPAREFTAAGERWLARQAGEGALGSGRLGSGSVEAVHFFREAEPERPVREALLPRGRFAGLHEEELRELWSRATVIEHGGRGTPAKPAPPAPETSHERGA